MIPFALSAAQCVVYYHSFMTRWDLSRIQALKEYTNRNLIFFFFSNCSHLTGIFEAVYRWKWCLHLSLSRSTFWWFYETSWCLCWLLFRGKVINGRFMSEVQPGMLMLLSESRDTVWFDSHLMETIKSTTACPNSLTFQYVLTQGRPCVSITGRQKLYRKA